MRVFARGNLGDAAFAPIAEQSLFYRAGVLIGSQR